MEVTGLAVGVAGLVSLFSACIDIIERVDSYQKYGIESRYISAQLHADTVLFKRWADQVGIVDGKIGATHHPSLDNAAVTAAVQRILTSIYEVFNEVHRSSTRLKVGSLEEFQSDRTSKLPTSKVVTLQPRKTDKLAWALVGKKKLATQVEAFKNLVEKLYGLVPMKDIPQKSQFDDLTSPVDGSVSQPMDWHWLMLSRWPNFTNALVCRVSAESA